MPGSSADRQDPVLLSRWETPAFLLRAYADERYAETFAREGKLCLRLLEYYQDIEDPDRRDEAENEFHSVSNKGIYQHRYQVNPKFVLCMSGPAVDPDYQTKHFGPYIVRIDDPELFARSLHEWLCSSCYGGMVGHIECRKVVYDATEEDYLRGGNGLIYANKPGRFRPEDEYRILVLCNTHAHDTECINIDFGGPFPSVRRLLRGEGAAR